MTTYRSGSILADSQDRPTLQSFTRYLNQEEAMWQRIQASATLQLNALVRSAISFIKSSFYSAGLSITQLYRKNLHKVLHSFYLRAIM